VPPALSIVLPYEGPEDIRFALDLATLVALRERRSGVAPPLYQAGVRYRRDRACTGALRNVRGACEPFKSPTEVIRAGRVGDCDDLAPWRAADRILAGDSLARAFPVVSPGVGWHILVRCGDGSIEDPSRRLGMGLKG